MACDGDQDVCPAPAAQGCGGVQVALYRDDSAEAQLMHYRADEKVVIDCNEYEVGSDD